MKTLSKKILTACLALMMAVAMAVPAFAATPAVASSPVGRTVGIHGYGNILAGALTANGAYNQAPVDLQQFKDKAGQKWNIEGNGNYGTIYTAQTVTGSRLAINLYRTAVSSGVYPVTLATTGGNVDDTYFYFSNYDGDTFRAWLQQGSYMGFRLYIDKSDSSSLYSDVYFVNSDKSPNTLWRWRIMW